MSEPGNRQTREPQQEVLEPEVLPPSNGAAAPAPRSPAERAFGPVLAGLLIDLIDLATFGPIGIALGFALGGGIAWYITGLYRLPARQRVAWTVAAGTYCTIPITEFIPVGTLVGAFVRYRELKTEERRREPGGG